MPELFRAANVSFEGLEDGCASLRRTEDLDKLLSVLERRGASDLRRFRAIRSELLSCFGARSCGAMNLRLDEVSDVAERCKEGAYIVVDM